ncbi:hypothetical protein BU24DRAFT_463366 [Aaosphaeria arxii CBS 175.79]|uniref:Transcription factor RfeG n=1 Tax=Aaosphaeria arxii CBS 175.79 TaxID=1450172 RepID=A0A6A5XP16_9PLEO|nr:uncharacterized protein BU24DRAFT_463366 [Aaosphaeria arxii CBS 175.79]KAF2014587.1 hypothetical protein BU24DRAFT_463366 [Aaosphaeria arxii CBS 175.79]
MARPRLNNWWVPGEGITRVVIQADIQRYLGPDALVKPGENEGRPGYWVTAYRTLTSEMINDLKLDTQRWEREQEQIGRRGSPLVREGKSRHPDFSAGQQDQLAAYRDSTIHQSRQYYGPTGDDPYGGRQQQQTQSRSGYDQSPNYTHSNPQQSYNTTSQPQGYSPVQPGYSSEPRTTQSIPQYSTGYPQQPGRSEHPGYSTQQAHPGYSQPQYSYSPQTQQAPPPPSRYFGYFADDFLVYR